MTKRLSGFRKPMQVNKEVVGRCKLVNLGILATVHFARWESGIYTDCECPSMPLIITLGIGVVTRIDRRATTTAHKPSSWSRPTRNKHQHYHMLYINKYPDLETLNSLNWPVDTLLIPRSHFLAFILIRRAFIYILLWQSYASPILDPAVSKNYQLDWEGIP